MKRVSLGIWAVLGVGLLPTSVRAYYPCWSPPPVFVPYFYAPPVVYVPIYIQPQASAPLAPPKVYQSEPRPLTTNTPPSAPKPAPTPTPAPLAQETPRKPVRSAEHTEPTPPAPTFVPLKRTEPPAASIVPEAPPRTAPANPPLLDIPTPPSFAPSTRPAAPKPPEPSFEMVPPVAGTRNPAAAVPDLILPPITPKESSTTPAVNPSPAKTSTTHVPDLILPAVPTPAPAPMEPSSLIPATAPQLPIPAGKGLSDTGLPSLVLPPVGDPKITAQASPLAAVRTALPQVRSIPVVAGNAAQAPTRLRKVGFFNYSDRDWNLVVDGHKVTLPRRHYVQAELPAKFVWKIGSGEEKTVTIPEGHAGVELLID